MKLIIRDFFDELVLVQLWLGCGLKIVVVIARDAADKVL